MNNKSKQIIKTLITVVSMAAFLSLAMILVVNKKKPQTTNVTNTAQAENNIKIVEVDRKELEEILLQTLEEEGITKGFKSHALKVYGEDESWVHGILFVYYSKTSEPPSDPQEYLVRKDKDGKILDTAFVYSEKFDKWLDIVPEEIIPESYKRFKYSSSKYSELYE